MILRAAATICFNSPALTRSNIPARLVSCSLIHVLPNRTSPVQFQGTFLSSYQRDIIIEVQHLFRRFHFRTYSLDTVKRKDLVNWSIVIRGDSVAAWCCAHLLTRAGFEPVVERAARPRLPAI